MTRVAQGFPVPLAWQHEDKPFRFSIVPAQHALYRQFNLVLETSGETLDDFTERLAAAPQ